MSTLHYYAYGDPRWPDMTSAERRQHRDGVLRRLWHYKVVNGRFIEEAINLWSAPHIIDITDSLLPWSSPRISEWSDDPIARVVTLVDLHVDFDQVWQRRIVLQIVDQVAAVYRITRKDVFEPCRIKHIAEARHTAIALTSLLCPWAYPRISSFFKRDHTSVLNSVKRMGKTTAVAIRAHGSDEMNVRLERALKHRAHNPYSKGSTRFYFAMEAAE
jgi:Bacterial dnaA protein helix-turn-helix